VVVAAAFTPSTPPARRPRRACFSSAINSPRDSSSHPPPPSPRCLWLVDGHRQAGPPRSSVRHSSVQGAPGGGSSSFGLPRSPRAQPRKPFPAARRAPTPPRCPSRFQLCSTCPSGSAVKQTKRCASNSAGKLRARRLREVFPGAPRQHPSAALSAPPRAHRLCMPERVRG
jgi:hypothetical protein